MKKLIILSFLFLSSMPAVLNCSNALMAFDLGVTSYVLYKIAQRFDAAAWRNGDEEINRLTKTLNPDNASLQNRQNCNPLVPRFKLAALSYKAVASVYALGSCYFLFRT